MPTRHVVCTSFNACIQHSSRFINIQSASSLHIRLLVTKSILSDAMSPTNWKYPPYQEAGAKLQRWIDGHWSRHCDISLSTLDARALEKAGWRFTDTESGMPSEVRDDVISLGYPYEKDPRIKDFNYRSFALSKKVDVPSDDRVEDNWYGRTGPGVIFLEAINRVKDSPNPPVSEISKALYEVDNDIDSLKHVYTVDVRNRETQPFVIHKLYTPEHGLDPTNPVMHEWMYGTPEYQGILGTRIGKMVGYLMLNSFEPGTRRISKIVTMGSSPYKLHIRFDIEKPP